MFTGELRDFQLDAARKMLRRGRLLLAMTMGAGKTPTLLAVTEDLIECGDASCGLVVVLASLKYQWKREVAKFTTSKALVIDGTKAKRREQYALARTGEYRYVILGYEQVRDDWDEVKTLPRDFVACDEATALASFKSKRAKAVKKLQAPFIYGLTGKPIENRLEELYGIMQWVDPSVLGRWDMFDRAFIVRTKTGIPVRYRNIPLLRDAMDPVWYRISEKDLADQLPEPIPGELPVVMDDAGAKLYKQIRDDLLDALDEAARVLGRSFDLFGHYAGEDAAANRARGKVMSRLSALRMLCMHPQLLRISAQKFRSRREDTKDDQGSEYAAELDELGQLSTPMGSPKLDRLVEYLGDATDEDRKVVVFTTSVEMLKLIDAAVREAKLPPSVLFHGGMSAKQRDTAKQTFQHDPNVRLFLSSDAGGYGVDLPQASVLINYDLPWSAGAADQRNARIVRLSSEHTFVRLIDVLVMGSVEEWVAEKIAVKRDVGDAIVDGKATKDGRVRATGDSLRSFLEDNEV